MRGGASRMVGRTLRISWGSFSRLSKKVTGMPQRMGRNSMTTRCAMWAEGRKTTVESFGPRGRAAGPISMLARPAGERGKNPQGGAVGDLGGGKKPRGELVGAEGTGGGPLTDVGDYR